MITLSCLIVLNREVQLKRHLGNALNIGLTPEQVVELIIHDTWYGGAPAGIQALTRCKEVFEERGIDFTPARIHDANEDPDSLFQRGDEYRRNYMGTGGGARPAPPTDAEGELGRVTGEYYWGATWTRPGLDLPSRCLCTMTCLAALGREGPLRSHIRGALNIGFTQDQIIEVFWPHDPVCRHSLRPAAPWTSPTTYSTTVSRSTATQKSRGRPMAAPAWFYPTVAGFRQIPYPTSTQPGSQRRLSLRRSSSPLGGPSMPGR